ncbi:hypothetical protein [Halotia branconii]|uniref:Uncharacterized protein n=1 Tax=Halotia branconii CENA392 TaxID=1539056 RepID=A0AAJ6P7N2_9CYAN|nr:hypothetical protein [Halotia branconii]WGV23801.1 hypothetical protein QI031_18530 [Halotia branconii CENA392]
MIIDLTGLKWSKNVNHQSRGKYWAYDFDSNSKIFLLNWKNTSKENAYKPKEGELIILRQRARVTHIVKLLNNVLYDHGFNSEFSCCRLVQVIWITNNWDKLPTYEEIFGYPINFPPDGKVMNLEKKEDFQLHWKQHKGLLGFQNHVQKELNKFEGNWPILIELCKCK